MQAGDGKLLAIATANVSLNSISLFVAKALPILQAVLITLQAVAAAVTVWHIFFRKTKNEKPPTPNDPSI